MKYSFLTIIFLGSSLVLAKDCPESLKLYGEASSYEKVDGKVIKQVQAYKIPKTFSDHIGYYDELLVYAKNHITQLEILGKKIPLKKQEDSYRSVGFGLSDFLAKKQFQGKFTIKFLSLSGESCTREYEVVHGE